MRAGRRAVAAALATVVVLGACRSNDRPSVDADGRDDGPSTVEQGQALKTITAGKLLVCTDVPRPPFAFDEGGEVRGIDVDVVRGMGGRLALAPEFRDVDPAGLLGALDQRQCDIVAAGLAITDVGKAAHDFTESYFEVRQALLVRKTDEGKYRDLAALNGRAVGVVKGSPGAAVVQKLGDGVVVKEFAAAAEAYAALDAAQVDGVVHDEPLNAYHVKLKGTAAIAAVFADEPVVQYGFAVPKGQRGLLDALNKALREIRTDDSYRTILSGYLGTPTARP